MSDPSNVLGGIITRSGKRYGSDRIKTPGSNSAGRRSTIYGRSPGRGRSRYHKNKCPSGSHFTFRDRSGNFFMTKDGRATGKCVRHYKTNGKSHRASYVPKSWRENVYGLERGMSPAVVGRSRCRVGHHKTKSGRCAPNS